MLFKIQKFAFFGVKLPKVHIESLEDFVLDQKDSIILSEYLDAEKPWIIGVTHCQKSEDVLDDQKTVPFL